MAKLRSMGDMEDLPPPTRRGMERLQESMDMGASKILTGPGIGTDKTLGW